jgi:xanthine dehydrogenase accessory factor
MKNIYLKILDIQPASSPLALATVTRTAGSTPQKPGSSVLFGQAGLLSGTVGGGVLEGKVQQIAQEAIISKESGHYQFNLDYDIFHEEDAICGGQVSVLVDATPGDHHAVFEQIKQSLLKRIPCVLITMVTRVKENRVLINRYWMTGKGKSTIPRQYFQKIEEEIRGLLSAGNPDEYRELSISLPEEKHSVTFFLEPHFPPSHLVIAGAGHIGKALAHLGSLLDFEVTVIDDRSEYANPENFPDADHIIIEDIGKAMQELEKTRDSYFVIVTRGHNDDAKALKPCFNSDAAYVGMIGSKTKIAKMHSNFIENGWATEEQWAEIHAPVGIDIMSKTIEEIAVSIAAELILERNRKKHRNG